jgi:hypothetical protein
MRNQAAGPVRLSIRGTLYGRSPDFFPTTLSLTLRLRRNLWRVKSKVQGKPRQRFDPPARRPTRKGVAALVTIKQLARQV